MDALTKFKLEQLDELRALVLERARLKLASDAAIEAHARSNERVEIYLKGMIQCPPAHR